jgi:hypothetical protein
MFDWAVRWFDRAVKHHVVIERLISAPVLKEGIRWPR